VSAEPPRPGETEPRPPTPPPRPPAPGGLQAPAGPPGPYAARRTIPASRSEKYVREKKFPWPLVVLLGAAPVGCLVYVLLMPAEKRTKFLDSIPQGVGSRAVTATISLAVLVVLARLVLPGAKAAVGALTRALGWFKGNRGMKRVLYAPAEAVVGLVWFLAQIVFAVDMVLVLACAIAFILYVVRIAKPDMFPFLPG
jgi:hypothetical protein